MTKTLGDYINEQDALCNEYEAQIIEHFKPIQDAFMAKMETFAKSADDDPNLSAHDKKIICLTLSSKIEKIVAKCM